MFCCAALAGGRCFGLWLYLFQEEELWSLIFIVPEMYTGCIKCSKTRTVQPIGVPGSSSEGGGDGSQSYHPRDATHMNDHEA